MIELGLFLPVGKNGDIVSTAASQNPPSYAMLKAMTRWPRTSASASCSRRSHIEAGAVRRSLQITRWNRSS
jgi:hypothetical protein